MSENASGEAIPTNKLVKAYIRMRDARSALKADYESKDADIKSQMEAVEMMLLDLCNTVGGNIKTDSGNIIRSIRTNYWTSDWEAMHKFVKENDALELLERRISQRAMKDFLEKNPDKVPMGLNADAKYTVTIRRS